MLLRSASLLSASSIAIIPNPFFVVIFLSYKKCDNKSRGVSELAYKTHRQITEIQFLCASNVFRILFATTIIVSELFLSSKLVVE